MPRFLAIVSASALLSCSGALPAARAQNIAAHAAAPSERVSGVVLNAVTHEPLGRALVYSPDGRFATMTDARGRFEFTLQAPDAGPKPATPPNIMIRFPREVSARGNPLSVLMARKPGFLDLTNPVPVPEQNGAQVELTISLVPEARVVGHVLIPASDGSTPIQVQAYRREVHEGQERWDSVATTTTRANGEFRFAELTPGSYKLLTREQLDRDPLTAGPAGQIFGYPPLYYPNASDFASAAIIKLAAGEAIQATMSPAKRAYYPVRVAVINAPAVPNVNVVVAPQGHPGPGYELGYNPQEGVIDGSLPDGIYLLQATGGAPATLYGTTVISVSGAPATGAVLTLSPGTSISVTVREEFQRTEITGPVQTNLPAETESRRPNYLQMNLLPLESFGVNGGAYLGPPTGPEDDSLIVENVLPGIYRVHAASGIGYVASVRCRGKDLAREPLVVSYGEAIPPIEVTVRDDGAEVEGIVDSGPTAQVPNVSPLRPGIVYFLSMDHGVRVTNRVWTNPDGSFTQQQLAPGTHSMLAFDRAQPELENASGELLEKFDAEIRTVHLEAAHKEKVKLNMIRAAE